MEPQPKPQPKPPRQPKWSERVGQQAARKVQQRERPPAAVWSGLGMMGLVGWSVAVPTLIGVAAGLWLDKHHPGTRHWTLMLLMAGLTLGCFNAWHWLAKEHREIRREHAGGPGEGADAARSRE